MRTLSLLVAGLFCAALWASAAEPEIVSVEKVWGKGGHNAFTDLVRFDDHWFLTFREADGHVKGDGSIRVLTSRDGETWESTGLVSEAGVDLRDPKISVTPDNRLMLLMGGSVYRDGKYVTRRPWVAFSSDSGATWSKPQAILHEGDWLWRLAWHDRSGYGASYLRRGGPDGPMGCTLYKTEDGVGYEKVVDWDIVGCTETTIRFELDGTMIATVRSEGDPKMGYIGRSRPPYKDWTWKQAGQRFGGQDFVILPNGQMWTGSRHYGDKQTTVVARMTLDSYEPVLTLPSGGDTSYPGMVYHDNLLWMSYYSSHEGKTDIYLAKIRLR
ncbi:MAG: sialidase family protein [Bryobacterales bacterium]